MNNKKGISLVMLVVTIIIILIIASTVAFTSSDATNNSKKAALALDLEQMEDLVEEYYLNNSENLPVLDDTSYTKAEIIALITEGSTELSDEINVNGDDSATFYEVDLSKLAIDSTSRGLKEDGDATDVYIVASNTFNVYYLKGVSIQNEYYFSLSERLTGKKKVNNSQTSNNSEITIVDSTSSIKLTKSTSDWTNELTVNVDTTLETGETVKYFIAGQEITESVTNNTIDVSSIVSSNDAVKTTFYSNDDNKIVTAKKYKNDIVITEATITVSNLDVLSGAVVSESNISHTKYDNFILVIINGYSDLGGSGVKEARVLYTTKLDADGNTVSYYDNLPSQITKEYVYNSGVKSDAATIKLPSDVTGYMLVFVDNAGNISDINSFTVAY